MARNFSAVSNNLSLLDEFDDLKSYSRFGATHHPPRPQFYRDEEDKGFLEVIKELEEEDIIEKELIKEELLTKALKL